ncbi:tetratricopeptide repeat protein [Flexithrix dorotheae]|uniref:tetratricopeptide repeat protein n=1 Tax=Flexithrix dorotheae TaxID=70993 RepID=UPI00036077DB|nr:tetratricopeptide repeat protein [Flexithrix dorotheae]
MKVQHHFIKGLTLLYLLFSVHFSFSQSIGPDETEKVLALITSERNLVKKHPALKPGQKVILLLKYGLFEEARKIIEANQLQTEDVLLAKAQYYFKTNDYFQAEKFVKQLLDVAPMNREGMLLSASLHIQAWELEEAVKICNQRLADVKFDDKALVMLGEIKLLQKQYDEALKLAKEAQALNANSAEAYLLESDVYFWQQQPEKSIEPLKKSLELNPYLVDARFNYGYAIWRKGEVELLDKMAEQWALALELNPLHYKTNWHWGNGHTQLTYKDYFSPKDDMVFKELKKGDELIAQNQVDAAIEFTYAIEKKFPKSVLPAMMRGSAFYMHYQLGDSRLDSAQRTFGEILHTKQNYGPAHNGLAAVVKQKRMAYLKEFDSLENAISKTEISNKKGFAKVFPDVNYYAGDRVQKMVWSALFSSSAYIPLLQKQKLKFVIPPLHRDLATAMNNKYFKESTTFDNRQWMDIRGVGSGAAGIEYVERGAHLERNVVLHEYVHLFHSRVFTDNQKRRVRALYYNAMKKGLTLDYYAANNEHEFLAQTYTAYFATQKVHPLNHKSMNTVWDLKNKDPETYAFIDSLVKQQNMALEGKSEVLNRNLAQVYINLSEDVSTAKDNPAWVSLASSYLDSALQLDRDYIPTYLSYSQLKNETKQLPESEAWLQTALGKDPNNPQVYKAKAHFYQASFENGDLDLNKAFMQVQLNYANALSLEKDLNEWTTLNRELREMYVNFGKVKEAIEITHSYLTVAPTISTYLRDKRDLALAFVAYQKGILGYPGNTERDLERLVKSNPQQLNYRFMLSEVLATNGKAQEGFDLLGESYLLGKAAGEVNPQLLIRMAEIQAQLGAPDKALNLVNEISDLNSLSDDLSLKVARIYLENGKTVEAKEIISRKGYSKLPKAHAEWLFAQALLAEKEGDKSGLLTSLELALKSNPYHLKARMKMVEVLASEGKKGKKKVKKMLKKMKKMPLAPGPSFQEKAKDLMNE